MDYRYRSSVYHIEIIQSGLPDVKAGISIDGLKTHDAFISLLDDGKEHLVEIVV